MILLNKMMIKRKLIWVVVLKNIKMIVDMIYQQEYKIITLLDNLYLRKI